MASQSAAKRAKETVKRLVEKADAAAPTAKRGRAQIIRAKAFTAKIVLADSSFVEKATVKRVITEASNSAMPSTDWVNKCAAVDAAGTPTSTEGKVSYGLAVIFSDRQESPEGVSYPSVQLLSKQMGGAAENPNGLLSEVLGYIGNIKPPMGHIARSYRNIMAGARRWAVKAKVEMPEASRRPVGQKTLSLTLRGPTPTFGLVEGKLLPKLSKDHDVLYNGTSCLFVDALNSEDTREWAVNVFKAFLGDVKADGLIGLRQVLGVFAREHVA
jgi:hypothetical protein